MNNQTTQLAIKHALQKIKDNATELGNLDPAASSATHCVFQMSYNIGRLSEITGLGRKLYDDVKPHIKHADWEFVVEAVEENLKKALPQ